MTIRFFTPNRLLAQHIDKLWVFESSCGIPSDDMKTSLPNGMMKMIIPYKGKLFSYVNERAQSETPESSISMVGLMETPVVIDGTGELGTIGIEFKPSSAYRFFRFSLRDTTNLVHKSDDIFGKQGLELQRRIADQPTVEAKIRIVENFLLRLLYASDNSDPIIDHAVYEISRSHGLVNISDLCKKLGYSKRYVDMKFADLVGVSPKTLAGISRFQKFFREIGLGGSSRYFDSELYDYYYDQSHFIREFRRFTGHSPRGYAKAKNEFGEIFYKG